MEDKLIEYTDKIIEALEAGVDFAGEQAPLLVQEVLGYYTFYYSTFLGLFLFLTLVFWVLAIYIAKSEGKNGDWDMCFIPLGMSIFPLIGVFINSFLLYKIIYAPRLFIIERLAEIL